MDSPSCALCPKASSAWYRVSLACSKCPREPLGHSWSAMPVGAQVALGGPEALSSFVDTGRGQQRSFVCKVNNSDERTLIEAQLQQEPLRRQVLGASQRSLDLPLTGGY